jgi:hypothetical protein
MTAAAQTARPLWQKILFAAVMLAIVCLLVGALIPRQIGNSDYRALLAKLAETDPNWRTGPLDEEREDIPPAKNSAIVIGETLSLLPRGWPTENHYKLFEDVPLRELFGPLTLAAIQKELDSVEKAVLSARRLADMPKGRHRLELKENPFLTLLEDQQNARRVASLLRDDAWRLACEKDVSGALRSVRGILNAGRSLGDEPFLISQLIRIACVSIACQMAERALSLGEADDESLSKLEELLKLEEEHPTLLIGLRGERALYFSAFDQIATGRIKPHEFFSPNELSWQERLFGISSSDVRRQQGLWLRLMTDYVDTAKLPAHERPVKEQAMMKELSTLPKEARLVRALLPALEKMSEATRRKDALVRCLRVAIAVERFRIKYKGWPDSLTDVTRKVPLDPYSGTPLRYIRTEQGVCIYSIGKDLVDNGGDLGDRNLGKPNIDFGCFLWESENRRVPVGLLPVPKAEPIPELDENSNPRGSP